MSQEGEAPSLLSPSATALRRRAARLRELAREFPDDQAAERLQQLADDLYAQAEAMDPLGKS